MQSLKRLMTRRAWVLTAPFIIAACVCTGSTLPSTTTTGGLEAPLPSLDQYGIDRSNALVLLASEVESLDPATWLFGAEYIVEDLFSGLVRLGPDMRPIPDLAERWDISADGTVYTFHLRENVTFHNGKAFTANDVKFSWDRAVSPEVGSLTASTYLGDIVGVREVAEGEAEEISGVKVLDDYTLEVTIDAPKAYFIYKLVYPVAWIVDAETVDEIDTNPNGTGPYTLLRHDEDLLYIVERFPDYYGGPVDIEHIVYQLNAGYGVRMYETGDIDMVTIEKDLVARAQDPNDPLYGNVQSTNSMCTDFLVFDVSQPPFDDPLVRRAFALSLDKERYNEVILENKGVMGGGLLPPGMPGYTPDVNPMPYDPDAAAEALRESTYGSVDALPPITYTTVGYGGNVSSSDGLMTQMWQQALGVTVQIEGLEFDSFYDGIYGDNHGQIISSGWCADYPDPENFAMLFLSESPQNHGSYANPDYDALVEEANSEPEVDRRLKLYQQAQQLLIDDAAGIFISHSQAYYLVTKPYLRGYIATPIGLPQHVNLSIDHGQ